MSKLPLDFFSQAEATADFEQSWTVSSGQQQAQCAIPAEFGGAGGGFSPEDLFLQALMNCFIGTFKVYAKSSRINFSHLKLKGSLTVDQTENKKVMMKKALLNIEIHGVDRPDRVETIVEKTFRDGFILNSVKTEIQYNLTIHPTITPEV